MNKILIMGLPTAGKTTLATMLAQRLNAVHFNADDVRANINRELGFSEADRIEHARRMGWLCDQVVKAGCFAIADFICPTPATRAAFAAGAEPFVIWVDRIKTGPYEDTNRMFVPPERVDLRVTSDGSPEYWTEEVMRRLRPIFDPKMPTALFLGRYQPFHDGHKALIVAGLERVGQAASQFATRKTSMSRIPSTSNMCAPASSTASRNSRAASWSFQCPTSRTSSMAAMSATASSRSISMPRSKKSRRPRHARSSSPVEASQGTESRLMAKRAEDLQQILRVPRGSFAPSFDRSLVGGLSDQVEGEMADDGHVSGAVAGAQARVVFIEGHVEGPV